MARITTGDQHPAELYYTDSGGPGRPIVLIHGWPASEKSWQAIAEQLLAAGHRVIAYDRRGFGQSSQPEGGYDYDTFADDLAALLTELDLVDAVLVGFSMGGGEVARYLARHGTGRVTGAVLIAAITPCLDASLADNPEGGFTPDAAVQMQQGLRDDPAEFLKGFLLNFYSVPTESEGNRLMVPDVAITDAVAVAEQASLDALATSIELWLTDFRADLDGLKLPTLVIHGDGDQIVPFEVSGERIPQFIPDAKIVVIEHGPHGLLHSHADQVGAVLLDFVG